MERGGGGDKREQMETKKGEEESVFLGEWQRREREGVKDLVKRVRSLAGSLRTGANCHIADVAFLACRWHLCIVTGVAGRPWPM